MKPRSTSVILSVAFLHIFVLALSMQAAREIKSGMGVSPINAPRCRTLAAVALKCSATAARPVSHFYLPSNSVYNALHQQLWGYISVSRRILRLFESVSSHSPFTRQQGALQLPAIALQLPAVSIFVFTN